MADTESPLSSEDESSVQKIEDCVICGDEPKKMVIKNDFYVAMLQCFWTSCEVDIKFQKNKELTLCVPCFQSMERYQSLFEMTMIFEKEASNLKVDIVKRAMGNIKKMELGKQPLDEVHKEFKARFTERTFQDLKNEDQRLTEAAVDWNYKIDSFWEKKKLPPKGDGPTITEHSRERKLRSQTQSTTSTASTSSPKRTPRETGKPKPKRKKRSAWSGDSDSDY